MITQARLQELLDYDPETGKFRRNLSCGRSRAGSIAGSMMSNGYRQIQVDKEPYLAHRLAWFYVHGAWPVIFIDHKNCDKDDNRIANLREADHCQNAWNSRSKSQLKGISYLARLRRWRAEIAARGKHIHLGLFDTAEDAHAAYVAASARLHGEFARAA